MTGEQGQLAPGEEQAAGESTEETSSLLAEITQATKLKPADEAYAMARKGVEALIAQLIEPGKGV
ncbi:type VI secretion system contractile sheath large subunit, partial [Desulfobulbus sp. US1]|nr:type VI secretion system contractile sheath large subunit [Desulfobulbus sp. US1]